MGNFLHYIGWFLISYPIVGLIVIIIPLFDAKHKVFSRIPLFIEIINIVFGGCLLVILISSLIEAKETTGKYFYGDISEWFWYGTMCIILFLVAFKKIRKRNYSILLFSFILLVGYVLFMSFFQLEPGV
jgi:hypothetical protein